MIGKIFGTTTSTREDSMNTYNVYNGEYPFDIYVGYVSAEDELTALNAAIAQYGKEYPHPVIEPMQGHELH